VIRHKNDWGAIVMMDSRSQNYYHNNLVSDIDLIYTLLNGINRFQQGAKINQLSKWLRPRIKTYQQILPALGDFRAFVTAALKDPSLQRAPKVI
jgi:Rad3-related DNA helicase